jgi:hypothetical protein
MDAWGRDKEDAFARFCAKCGERLGMGPANDGPKVLVEIRAAVLADRVARALPLGFLSLDEEDGYATRRADADAWRRVSRPADWDAGWLAHAIVSHPY